MTASQSFSGEDQKVSSQNSQSEVKDQGNKSSDTKSNTEDSKSSEHRQSASIPTHFKPKDQLSLSGPPAAAEFFVTDN